MELEKAMETENDLKCLNDLVLQYEETGDIEKMKPLLAEGFTIVRSNGEVQDLQAFLAAVPGNAQRGRKTTESQVQLMGDTAVVISTVETSSGPEGKKEVGRFRNTRVFVRDDGGWRCLSWQVARISQPQAQAGPCAELAAAGGAPAPSKVNPAADLAGTEKEKALRQIQEMLLDYFAIPRPGKSSMITELQDILLPRFIQDARFAWMAVSPYHSTLVDNVDQVLKYLEFAILDIPQNILRFSEIQERLGFYAFLEELARSPYYPWLVSLPLDPSDVRLLKESGHPNPDVALTAYLQRAAQERAVVSAPKKVLDWAEGFVGKMKQSFMGLKQKQPVIPINRHTLSGLAKVSSGLALWAGNAATMPFTAIVIVPCATAGLVAVLDGVNDIKDQSEQTNGAKSKETGKADAPQGGKDVPIVTT
ncbi:MAG: nuclear transport factor 2 family protein [Chloroflexi bacterium]|nr:MAG: nuclear transport factor 2 family protein [Chloroflexota bacterium]